MNPKMKKFLRDLTPPVIWRGARRLLRIGRASPAHCTTARFLYPLWAVGVTVCAPVRTAPGSSWSKGYGDADIVYRREAEA
jgi:hypothetical protein